MSPAVAPRIRGVSMDARSLILRLLERDPSRYGHVYSFLNK